MVEWIERPDALRILGIKAQALYAYVSRGLIEARRQPEWRHSLYRFEDVTALAGKRSRSRKPAAFAAGSMTWGEPSVTTPICTVHRGHLIYRGVDAVAFSRDGTLEGTASLLWDSKDEDGFNVPCLNPRPRPSWRWLPWCPRARPPRRILATHEAVLEGVRTAQRAG